MNDEQVFRILAETNPYPVVDAGRTPTAPGPLDGGQATVITKTKTTAGSPTDPPPGGRKRRWSVAVGSAAIVMTIALFGVWATFSLGEDAADDPDVASVVGMYAALNHGDVDAWVAAVTPRLLASLGREQLEDSVAVGSQTEFVEPCRKIEPSPTTGRVRVQCTVSITDDFLRPAGISVDWVETYLFAPDGRPDDLVVQPVDLSVARAFSNAFWQWLQVEHPTAYGKLRPFGIGSDFAPETNLGRVEYVDEFITQSADYPIDGPES